METRGRGHTPFMGKKKNTIIIPPPNKQHRRRAEKIIAKINNPNFISPREDHHRRGENNTKNRMGKITHPIFNLKKNNKTKQIYNHKEQPNHIKPNFTKPTHHLTTPQETKGGR